MRKFRILNWVIIIKSVVEDEASDVQPAPLGKLGYIEDIPLTFGEQINQSSGQIGYGGEINRASKRQIRRGRID